MRLRSASLTNVDPSKIHIISDITCSDASSISEIELDGQKCALKLFHDNGDPGYTEKGRDLNRVRCELNAYLYKKLFTSGVCAHGFDPKLYGYINRMDPAAFYNRMSELIGVWSRAVLLNFISL
jgi:hypothetical protein